MLQATITSYGQSLISSSVHIDGIALLRNAIDSISSASYVASYTSVLDIEASGNVKNNACNLLITDNTTNSYEVKTVLFYVIAGTSKRVVAGYTSSSAIVNKDIASLSIVLPFDLSCFTNGFTLALTKAIPNIAYHNSDGIVHIDDSSSSIDDSYSVYSKQQVDQLLEDTISSANIFCVCDISGTGVSHTLSLSSDYRPEKPLDLDSERDNPKWRDAPVSLAVNKYFNFSSVSRVSLFVPEATYVGSVAFYSSNEFLSYTAYPIHFRGNESYHNASVPAGSILRLTYYQHAFYTDFYDLGDFGSIHEPIVRIGKLIHENELDSYIGTLVGVRADNGKLDRLLSVNKGSPSSTTMLAVANDSPIYVSFNGTCFSSYPRVPFGFITKVNNLSDDFTSDDLPFYYVESGEIVTDTSIIEQNFITNTYNALQYFHIDGAPVYLNLDSTSGHLIYIGGIPSYAAESVLIGFLCNGAENAGLIRLVQCGIHHAKNSSAVNIQNTESSVDKPLVFTDSSLLNSPISRKLYTDASNSLYYNPTANVLTCSMFSGSLSGNADSATVASSLSLAPSLSWSDATSSSAGSTLSVTAGGKTSSSATITTVRRAYNSYVSTYSASASCPLVFSLNVTAGFKPLYTDTDNMLYYNPSTNELHTASVSTNTIVPNANNGYNLGSSNAKWSTLFCNTIGNTSSPTNVVCTKRLIIPRGSCTTAAGTASKTVSCSPAITSADLVDGLIISVYFSNSNTVSTPTLNVDSTGAHNMYQLHGTSMSSTIDTSWSAGEEVLFVYYVSGSTGYWCRLGRPTYPTSTASGTTNIIPSSNNSYNLGSTSYRWKSVYAGNSSASHYLEIGADTVSGVSEPTIRPSATNYGYIGTSSYHLYYGYINNLYGTLHTLYGTGTGAIYFFKLVIKNNSSSAIEVPRGTQLTSATYFSSSKLQITSWEEKVDDTSQSAGTKTFSGSFTTLLAFSVAANASSASVYVPCLRTS